MKTHTNDFKNAIKRFGREIDSKFTFTYNGEEIDFTGAKSRAGTEQGCIT